MTKQATHTARNTEKTVKLAIQSALQSELINLGIEKPEITLERPADLAHGDYATNVALAYAKQLKKAPLETALLIVAGIKTDTGTNIEGVEKIEVAGPGFINFYLSKEAIENILKESFAAGEDFGKTDVFAGKKNLYEYTDPNPFKIFHIGHVMANTVGESLARLGEFGGAEVRRFCYQGDVGRHIALAMWGLRFFDQPSPTDATPIRDKVKYWGDVYACGATKFYDLEKEAKELAMKKGLSESPTDLASASPEFEKASQEVASINKKIYDRSDEEINTLYDSGKEWSLEYFEILYDILGTKFDQYFFESQAAGPGLEVIKAHPEVFEQSDGAIVFKGEAHGTHTRVFVNKDGLPTYEGKEMGLAKMKYDAFPYDIGYTVTANEQDGYFSVINQAIELVYPELKGKLVHLSHGMMKLTTGKMSSRKGGVVAGEEMIDDIKETAVAKMNEAGRKFEDAEKEKIAEQIAVAAIKFTVLKQTIGKDIVFDKEKSLSVEGDSGPYLQYSAVRANSILEKGKMGGFRPSEIIFDENPTVNSLQKLLVRFPEIVARSQKENAPHHIATYLIEVASLFNSYYNSTQIVVENDPISEHRLALVQLFLRVIRNGLYILGIKVPERM